MAALAIEIPKEDPNDPNKVSRKGLNDTFCPQCVNPLAKELRKEFKLLGIECENVSDAVFAFLVDKYKLPVASSKPIKIGQGNFGEVYQAGDQAIKRITRGYKSEPDIGYDSIQLLIELAVMAKLDSPYIVKFQGFYIDAEQTLNIIMEHMKGKDLFDFFEHSFDEKPSLHTVLTVLLDVAKGVHFLHSQSPPIVHRDLKIENVLLDAAGHAKITDFGTINFYLDADNRITTRVNKVGTPQYLPPRDAEVSPALDMYAFGVICVMMLATLVVKSMSPSEYTQFENLFQPEDKNQRAQPRKMLKTIENFLKENEAVDAELLSLIKLCLDPEAGNRPSAQTMVKRLEALAVAPSKRTLKTAEIEELVEAQKDAVKKLRSEPALVL